LRKTKNSILVIGLGEIGYNNAEYMTKLGLNVDGYDIDDRAVKRALDSAIIHKKAKTFAGYDYYIISVSTHNPQNMFTPAFDGLLETAYRLAYEGEEGSLVTVESTVTKGMSDKIKTILDHRLHVAHVPHRYYAQEKEEHGVCQTRVLGGCESCCSAHALYFYQELLDIPVYAVRSVELAELSKVIENSYRFMEIAFAEELKMLCDAYSIDFNELRNAVNSKWNVKILEAKRGIGGHCLPKDSQMYIDLSKQVLPSSMVDAAKAVDEHYRMQLIRDQSVGLIPGRLVDLSAT
jgi:UDP-N-acetyl-D-mannosaminuronic acid dehydrogenase